MQAPQRSAPAAVGTARPGPAERVGGGGEVKILGREPHHHEDPGFYLEYDWDQHGKGFEQSTARI